MCQRGAPEWLTEEWVQDQYGFTPGHEHADPMSPFFIQSKLRMPGMRRVWYVPDIERLLPRITEARQRAEEDALAERLHREYMAVLRERSKRYSVVM